MSTTTTSPFPIYKPFHTWWSVRSICWLWRNLALRPLWWFRRNFWKICLWTVTIITLAWQYENWHGRTALAEQRALFKAEFGEITWPESPGVPDDQNFFAAPVFDKFVLPYTPAVDNSDQAVRKAISENPHCKYLCMKMPEIAMPKGDLPRIVGENNLLDVHQWAADHEKTGVARPAGLTDAQWLHSLMPKDENLEGLIQALARPESVSLPTGKERREIGDKIGNRFATPIPALSGIYNMSQKIQDRAIIAAQAGDGKTARDLCEILCRYCEGGTAGDSLVQTLVGLAQTSILVTALEESLKCGMWNKVDLQHLEARCSRIDEEVMLRNGLHRALLGWPLMDPKELHKLITINVHESSKRRFDMPGIAFCNGPDGWLEANMATYLRWICSLLHPDGPGDDLVLMRRKWNDNIARVNDEVAKSMNTPRNVIAKIAFPAASGILDTAINNQTRRRQIMLAMAVERYRLQKGALPTGLEELVPEFVSEIPGDPWKPGTRLQFTTGTDGERFRIASAGITPPLIMPTLPQ